VPGTTLVTLALEHGVRKLVCFVTILEAQLQVNCDCRVEYLGTSILCDIWRCDANEQGSVQSHHTIQDNMASSAQSNGEKVVINWSKVSNDFSRREAGLQLFCHFPRF